MLSQKDQVLLILNAIIIFLGCQTLSRNKLSNTADDSYRYWSGIFSVSFGLLSVIALLLSCSGDAKLNSKVGGLDMNYFHAGSLVAFLLSAYNNYKLAELSTGNDRAYTWLNIVLHLAVLAVFFLFEKAERKYDEYKASVRRDASQYPTNVSSSSGSRRMLNNYVPRAFNGPAY